MIIYQETETHWQRLVWKTLPMDHGPDRNASKLRKVYCHMGEFKLKKKMSPLLNVIHCSLKFTSMIYYFFSHQFSINYY